MLVDVNEKNIGNDVLETNEIEVYADKQKIDLEATVVKKEANEFQIELVGLPKEKMVEVKIKEGAFIDTLGWRSDEYIEKI